MLCLVWRHVVEALLHGERHVYVHNESVRACVALIASNLRVSCPGLHGIAFVATHACTKYAIRQWGGVRR